MRFEVTDGKNGIPVNYQGVLPDLFREGHGVVAEGALDPADTFRADSILAKHDETYMPKEVADALKRSGHWKDDYGRQAGTPAGAGAKMRRTIVIAPGAGGGRACLRSIVLPVSTFGLLLHRTALRRRNCDL